MKTDWLVWPLVIEGNRSVADKLSSWFFRISKALKGCQFLQSALQSLGLNCSVVSSFWFVGLGGRNEVESTSQVKSLVLVSLADKKFTADSRCLRFAEFAPFGGLKESAHISGLFMSAKRAAA